MKKAILVVSFGTTDNDALKLSSESIENKIRDKFPDYEVRRAFTSRLVIEKIAERDGIQIDNEQEALARLQVQGYKEVFVQPIHLIPDFEYQKVRGMVVNSPHAKEKVFDKITIGRPLLYYMGQQGTSDDCMIAIKAIENQLPKLGIQDAVVFMNYGAIDPIHAAYAALQMKLEEEKLHKVFIYTVNGIPSLDMVIEKLKENKVKKVTLMPFILVSAATINIQMAGEEENSAKSQFLKAGFEVDVYTQGLCENVAIQDIYVQHIKDAIDQSTKNNSRKY